MAAQTVPARWTAASLIFLGLLAGCTSTGDLATDLQAAAEEELALPETVAVRPSAKFTDADVALDSQSGEPPVVASAFAGATPSSALQAAIVPSGIKSVAPQSPELDQLIAKYAAHYEIPVELVRRVVKRESNFNPGARNRIYWGLMQIRHDTARTMGYRGAAEGLLDAETNLKYAVKYLRGAYLTADGNHDRAVRFYARGYYYDAKRKGILRETGLRS
ncbi:lytic transglycosylase domain-containing protein [Aliihoeflea sp. 40Bstr573]|uniref:lytic transglycosylase domain-containing protein n=1 Tax=Aliihoeflea sp. 40Bstr573 TaxID=2696467 RepID=UPI002095A0A0|nr:lytic transglycosylase domain-containing protein [Aliihoeflea sp. 40Bstr573]